MDLLDLYRAMARARAFELLQAELWQRGLISGEMHLGTGEEAIAAGIAAHLKAGDAVALDHRPTPVLLLLGVDPVRMLHEVLGHEKGLCRGQGGNKQDIGIGPDNLFIHMTGMSDFAWRKVYDVGAQVSIAFPIEMNMRHGMPPILRMQSLSMARPNKPAFEPSLSVDVECTLTADFVTQMRSAMNLQRMLVNQMTLDSPNTVPGQNLPNPLDWGLPQSANTVGGQFPYWPPLPAGVPAPLTTRDVLRYATINGAKALGLDRKTGSLTPGKEADIIILDATKLNVAPLNQVPGAVVSLMDRTNVETVIVAGKVRKWKGQLLDVDLDRLRQQIEASRDYIFSKANIPQNPFSSQ